MLCVSLLVLALLNLKQTGAVNIYNVSNEICCDGRLHARPAGHVGFRCCGSQLLTPGQGICCYDQPMPFPPSVQNQFFNWGCCGRPPTTKLFNLRTQLCCDGEVVEAGGDKPVGCCGKKPYDFSKGLCCHGVMHQVEHPAGLGCCGHNSYNFTTHLCCSQETFNRNNSKQSTKIEFALHPLPDDLQAKVHTHCCGLDTYSTAKQVCCSGGVRAKPENMSADISFGCCGDVPISDPQSQICCDGKLRVRTGQEQWCCGSQLYNINSQLCCADRISPLTNNTSCCWKAEQVFDPQTQLCCGKQVLNLNETSAASSPSHSQQLRCCEQL